jgi:hypothetical protein
MRHGTAWRKRLGIGIAQCIWYGGVDMTLLQSFHVLSLPQSTPTIALIKDHAVRSTAILLQKERNQLSGFTALELAFGTLHRRPTVSEACKVRCDTKKDPTC